jgi:hypothetical protein
MGNRAERRSCDWQAGYINTSLEALSAADWSDSESARKAVLDRMHQYLPSERLRFLMELSIDPTLERLGLSR